MEQQPDERDATSATRSQHVVYTLAHDWSVIPQFLAPALERIDPASGETQLLIITADTETAVAVADAALALRHEPNARPLVVPITRPERAARLMRAGAPVAVAGTPETLAAVIGSAALKLDGVKTLVFAWADAIVATPAAAHLDAVLTEVPKDASRVMVTTQMTDAVEALIESHMRRARRVVPTAAASAQPLTIGYVAVAPSARPAALQRLFDEMDPPSAAVVVSSDASETEARRALRTLGYHASGEAASETDAFAAFGPDVRVTRGEVSKDVAVVVLYDVPTERATLDRIASAKPAQIVALAQPRQLDALRALALGAVMPLALPDHGRRARARDEAILGELRATLEAGVPHRELLALEPMLEQYDGVQLAAAALKLLEQARAQAALAPIPRAASAAPSGDATGMTRLFISVGNKDSIRVGDLVGAITAEAGISSDKLGKIEIRDAFSLVEVASADAARVIERVNGIAIRGRKAAVREEREPRGGGGGDRPRGGGGDRPRGGAGGGDRPRGGGFGGGDKRGGDRRPASGGGPGGQRERGFITRGEGPRGFGAPDDRGVSERAEQRDEWAGRAERLRRARRDPETREDSGPAGGPMDQDEG